MQQEVKILYEDGQIIVCDKPAGIPTQSRDALVPDMVSILKNHLRAAGAGPDPRIAGQKAGVMEEPYLATIHRLDTPVRGLLVFAKTPGAAKELNRQLNGRTFTKEYLTLVDGTMPKESGILEDYLVRDQKANLSRVCSRDTPGAKLARLEYRVLREGEADYLTGLTLFHPGQASGPTMLHIRLETGRHHQIRVQLAHSGHPVIGDTKYNPDTKECAGICLCACRLSFYHPATHAYLHFRVQ